MNTILGRLASLLCVCLLALPSALRAQSVADLSPGTRVRVVDLGTGRIVGTVSAVRGDTLVVLAGKGDGAHEVALSVSSIRQLQVSRGRPSRAVSALQGAGIGMVTGALGGVAGATIGGMQSVEECRSGEEHALCFSTGQWTLIGVMVGAPFGAAWGAAAGFLFPQERWSSLPIRNAPAITVAPSGDALRLGVSLSVP